MKRYVSVGHVIRWALPPLIGLLDGRRPQKSIFDVAPLN